MEAYDQTKFIENRNEKIKEVKTSAKQMNDIAQDINQKVDDQGQKLDTLEKELGSNASFLKSANEDLYTAS